LEDIKKNENKEVAEDAHILLELLTPIAKTYPSEMGRVAISNGLQVLGGYGYCMDFPLQQYYRDIRIMSIYEGTTGIQSLDLLGRKIPFNNGQALELLLSEIQKTIGLALGDNELKRYAHQLKDAIPNVELVLNHLMPFAARGNYERFLADASLFMEFMSHYVIAWQCLMMAVKAKSLLASNNEAYSKDGLESKIHGMKFYFTYELPRAEGIKTILLNNDSLTIKGETEHLI
jgi:butyryl-CoA dehydrogenase